MSAYYPALLIFFQVTPSWYDQVLMASSNEMWIQNFRLPKSIIDTLCDDLKNDLSPHELTVREPISLIKRFEI